MFLSRGAERSSCLGQTAIWMDLIRYSGCLLEYWFLSHSGWDHQLSAVAHRTGHRPQSAGNLLTTEGGTRSACSRLERGSDSELRSVWIIYTDRISLKERKQQHARTHTHTLQNTPEFVMKQWSDIDGCMILKRYTVSIPYKFTVSTGYK